MCMCVCVLGGGREGFETSITVFSNQVLVNRPVPDRIHRHNREVHCTLYTGVLVNYCHIHKLQYRFTNSYR